MPRNSSGTYTLPLPPVVSGETIEADWANETLADIAQALTDSLDRLGRGGMTGPFTVADGSAAAPGLAFTNEPTTGIYRAGSGVFGISTSGVSRATFDVNGINTKAVYVTDAILQDQQVATKAYVDAATGGGGGGTGYLSLGGGNMTGTINFRNVSTPLSFKDSAGTTTWGNIFASSGQLTFQSGGQSFSFSAGGILSAPNVNVGQDLTANNDIYARRWIGVGTESALIYTGVDSTFGKYIGMRSPTGSSAFTYFDDGTGAANILRGLTQIISTGRVDAYNAGVRIRYGSALNAGSFIEMIIDSGGDLIWRDSSQVHIMRLTQAGNLIVKGNVTPNSSP